MKSINFKESTCKIGFQQDEYQGIYAHREELPEFPGAIRYTMCFELDEEERKQVAETGQIWLKRLQPKDSGFHPIGPDVLMPEYFQNVDEVKGVEDFDPETFDLKTEDFSKVNYFYKKAAIKHLGLKPEGKTEEEFTQLLIDAQANAIE